MVMKPGEHQRSKQRYQNVGWKVHNSVLLCAHTLCMSHVTNTFHWLVNQYEVNNYCVLCRVKAKKATKNLQQRTLAGFITIPLY